MVLLRTVAWPWQRPPCGRKMYRQWCCMDSTWIPLLLSGDACHLVLRPTLQTPCCTAASPSPWCVPRRCVLSFADDSHYRVAIETKPPLPASSRAAVTCRSSCCPLRLLSVPVAVQHRRRAQFHAHPDAVRLLPPPLSPALCSPSMHADVRRRVRCAIPAMPPNPQPHVWVPYMHSLAPAFPTPEYDSLTHALGPPSGQQCVRPRGPCKHL